MSSYLMMSPVSVTYLSPFFFLPPFFSVFISLLALQKTDLGQEFYTVASGKKMDNHHQNVGLLGQKVSQNNMLKTLKKIVLLRSVQNHCKDGL